MKDLGATHVLDHLLSDARHVHLAVEPIPHTAATRLSVPAHVNPVPRLLGSGHRVALKEGQQAVDHERHELCLRQLLRERKELTGLVEEDTARVADS